MKKTKRMLALLLSLVMVFSAVAVFAEDAEVVEIEETADVRLEYPVTAVNLGDYLGKKSAWMTQTEGAELTFKNGKISSQNDSMVVFGNQEYNFSDGLIQFNAKFSFEDGAGEASWSGLTIRDRDCGIKAWQGSGGGYLFVIKSDRIELQRWRAGGQTILDVVPNDYIEHGKEAEISVAAVNTEAGVCVFLFVDGVCVINVCDADKNAVTEGDYFNIYASKGTEVSKYTGDVIPALPTAPVITVDKENGYKFVADYDLVSFGEEAEDVYSIDWAFSIAREGENLTDLDKDAKNEFGSKYALVADFEALDVEGEEIEPTLDQANGYFVARVVDAEGNVIAQSASEKIESEPVLELAASKLIAESVALVVDYESAFVNGEKTQIDANDDKVKPTVIDGRTLVPVRFIAESFKANVGWDDATQKVTIELDGKTIVMTLNETAYTVDGEEKQLDVPATTIYGRTMVPVRAISVAFEKAVFWEGENELIIISNEELNIDVENDMSILNYIAKEIR